MRSEFLNDFRMQFEVGGGDALIMYFLLPTKDHDMDFDYDDNELLSWIYFTITMLPI